AASTIRSSSTASSQSQSSVPTVERPGRVSPFAADSARKGDGPRSRMESDSATEAAYSPFSASGSGAAVVMGAAAPAIATEKEPQQRVGPEAVPVSEPAGADAKLGQAVLTELEKGGYCSLGVLLGVGCLSV